MYPEAMAADSAFSEKLSTHRLSRKDRRAWRRIPIDLPVRVLGPDGVEMEVRSVDLSAGGAAFRGVGYAPGSNLLLSSDRLGQIAAECVRKPAPDLFCVRFEISARKRDKLADQLVWLANKDKLALEDGERRAEREGGGGSVEVTIGEARVIAGRVIDISLTGVAVETRALLPQIGASARIGPYTGRVARHLPNGFAIDFTSARRAEPTAD